MKVGDRVKKIDADNLERHGTIKALDVRVDGSVYGNGLRHMVHWDHHPSADWTPELPGKLELIGPKCL